MTNPYEPGPPIDDDQEPEPTGTEELLSSPVGCFVAMLIVVLVMVMVGALASWVQTR